MDLGMAVRTVETLRETAGDRCDVLFVDDASPEDDLVAGLREAANRFDADMVAKDANEGFSRAVNVGLRRCLRDCTDAILVNADIEFGLTEDWLGLMLKQRGENGRLAAIVGGLLVYPNGLIQHGGIYFSLLTREFGHRFQWGPGNLPEAQVAARCPVTGALQFIRHETLMALGPYDETFKLGWEDVDYGIRAFLSGRECIYQPGIRAVHHESAFRGRADEKILKWTEQSWLRFCGKYSDVSFAEFVPNLLGE
jgi:GT2 family glycosyltransferase